MKNKSLVYIFFVSVLIISILDVINKDEVFSELENRFLKKKPTLKLETLLNGQYSKDYETYLNDHFIGRNNFINLKSIAETLQLKEENNGIIYGKDGYMFEKSMSLNSDVLTNNLLAIEKFIEKNNNSQLMLVPYSFSILENYYNKNLTLLDEKRVINEIEKYFGENFININETLIENKDEYIYYKTDHHWTTYGAYLAYKEYCDKKDINDVMDINSLGENNVENFLGTFYSKSKLFNAESDILTYYDMPSLLMQIDGQKEEGIYKLENLKKRDKYSVFLDGNHSSVKISNNDAKNEKTLLVIKDSFANSMIPFLANNYKEIRVLDLRYFNYNMSEFLNSNKFDDVLILYSLDSMQSDKNIVKIAF